MDKEQAEVEGRMIDASGSSDATITVFLVSHNWVQSTLWRFWTMTWISYSHEDLVMVRSTQKNLQSIIQWGHLLIRIPCYQEPHLVEASTGTERPDLINKIGKRIRCEWWSSQWFDNHQWWMIVRSTALKRCPGSEERRRRRWRRRTARRKRWRRSLSSSEPLSLVGRPTISLLSSGRPSQLLAC